MKDYSVVGQYDVLLCYADHKAIHFFHRYGFTDNPIIAHKWRYITSRDMYIYGCMVVLLECFTCKSCSHSVTVLLEYIVCLFRHLTDPWDNSTLMSYIAPFSGPTLSLGVNTSTAITNMEQHLERWLQEGFSQHYQQLSFMERLRNEIILLHAKVSHKGIIAGFN